MSERDQQSQASTSRPGSPIPPLPDFSNARPYRFAWDSSTRKQGPGSVSGTTEGRGDYFAYRPALGNFNLSSTNLTLGAIPSDWSSAKLGFNAISTLVNSPHKKSAPPKAHASVPPVVPSQLPRVRRKDFDGYLKAIAPEWEQFEKTLQVGRDEQTEAFAAGLAEMELHQSVNEPPPSSPFARSSRGVSIPSLDSVPLVFFSPTFDLSDPKTFATVTEQSIGLEDTSDTSALSHSLPLLEKLSHHADTIELHLIREISLRSSSFFAALTNLNELQTESTQCLDRIRRLHGMLREIDEGGAKKGLEIVRRERKVKNLIGVREAVKIIQSVGEMLGLASNLASGGEWESALGLAEELEGLWNRGETEQHQPEPSSTHLKSPLRDTKRNSLLASVPESIAEETEAPVAGPSSKPHVIPLSSLHAFASLPDHLRTLTSEIAASLSSELVSLLRMDLVSQMDLPKPKQPRQTSVSDEVDPTRAERLTTLRDRLRPLARGLKRTNTLKVAVSKWTAVALVEIKSSMKKPLPLAEELDEDTLMSTSKDAEKGSALRNYLREMSHEGFMKLMSTIYGTLLHGIQELQAQNAILGEVVGSLETREPSVEVSPFQADLADLLFSATELAHSKTAILFNTRAEKHASLDLQSFLEVFNETWKFLISTETICRRMIVGLRGAAVSQAKALLQAMHQDHISQSAKLVEEEQWLAADVTSDAQSIVNVIIDSAIRDSPELVVPQPQPSSPQPNGAHNLSTSAKHLNIEDRKYYSVAATLHVVGLLVDYLKIIVNLSLLTTDTVGRVIEFLKAFNSRTCQVVLGAGAMRSAGLKNITAKHLALASQSLSIIIALIPYVRECFRRHLNPKQAVMLVEFDKLKRDYQEHQQEIHAKLVAIMGDRLNAHCKTLQSVDWSAPRDNVNDYMTVLVKETVTLHKVLSRYLHEGALELIMSQVFAAINVRLSEEFGKIGLPNQEAKEGLLRDARYLHQNFSNLKNVNASTAMLETVVNEKQVPQPVASRVERSQSNSSAALGSAKLDATANNLAAQPQAHSLAANAAHTMESANERLRSIFKRGSLRKHDTKPALASPSVPSPIVERQDSSLFLEKAPVEELGVQQPASPPLPLPPTPEKPALDTPPPTMRPSSPLSLAISERSRSRSPRPREKALPIPLPTLDVDGNIVDPPEPDPSECPSPPPIGNGINEEMKSTDAVLELAQSTEDS